MEDEVDKQQDEDGEENPPSEAEKAKDPMDIDIDSLEEPPSGTDGQIVSNALSSRVDQQQHQEGDGGGQQPSRGQEARLREELHALAQELQRRKRDREDDELGQQEKDGGVDRLEGSRELWVRLRSVTGALSQRLCEQLRLVLEPMVATKLQGDYRSGKRINMRRVIPYIASGFRKDKIWLRRTKPAKRDYQVCM